MNGKLQSEILKQIFSRFGVVQKNDFPIMNATDNAFLIDKRIAFASENKQYSNKVWGIAGGYDKSEVKILLADTKDDIQEFVLLFQIDSLPIYAMQLSLEEGDIGSFCFLNEKKWLHCGVGMQAKFLYGVENLGNHLITWRKMDRYKDLYEKLVEFLKNEDN